MLKATVKVTTRLCVNKHSGGNYSGKFATRVGEVLVMHRKICRDEGKLEHQQPAYDVVVPPGSVLSIEVDWQIIKTDQSRVKHLQVVKFDKGTSRGSNKIDGHEVEVNITWASMEEITEGATQEFIIHPQQPSRPAVEVKVMSGDDIAIVYTIGDEVSFTEFIATLRCILAYHPYREDILDDHDSLNLSATREHPVLPELRDGEQPPRWIHVKLQVREEDNTMYWTTLLMRGDNLYVHGFIDRHGGVYALVDNKSSVMMLPNQYKAKAERREWSVRYRTMLGSNLSNDAAAHHLAGAHLGCRFTTVAVRVLSRAPTDEYVAADMNPRTALAGLIVIVCESARMNPIHDAIADGWSNGTGFTKQLMRDYVWVYGNKSGVLLRWKHHDYNNIRTSLPQHPIKELQDIYLVLNTPALIQSQKEDKNNRLLRKDDNAGSGGGPASKSKEAGNNAGSSSVGPASKSKEAGNNAGSSSVGPASKHVETGDAGSGGGHSDPSQSGKSSDGDDDPSGGNSGRQHGKADDATGHGRPRVELLALAMRADLRVAGMTIIVFDGKRGQIIYTHEEQGGEEVFDGKHGQIIYTHEEQGGEEGAMVKLVLTGPYTGISAYGCFAIKIDTPNKTPIKWEWDGYKPEYAAEVDKPPKTYKIGEVAEVTCMVMSNALEATVQVKLCLRDEHSRGAVTGKITAYINDFKDGSVLFSHRQGTLGQCFSLAERSWFDLHLARDVVAVPCGGVLHIEVLLEIRTSDNQGVKNFEHTLDFISGNSSQHHEVNGDIVEVNISWYPKIARSSNQSKQTSEEIEEQKHITTTSPEHPAEIILPEKTSEEIGMSEFISAHSEPSHPAEVKHELVYTIGNALSFCSFMMDLRRFLADHPDRQDILDSYNDSNISSTRDHPVLAKQHAEQPARWLHVKLQVVQDEEKAWTTLLMRDDNLYVCGFMNQQGVCYELLDHEDSDRMLPNEYNPQRLYWGVKYRTILDATDNGEFQELIGYSVLGKAFAVNAVHALSRFPDWAAGGRNPRMALAGLILMTCECARMNRVLESFEDDWDRGTIITKPLMDGHIQKYGKMSHDLRRWKDRNYDEPDCVRQRRAIYLVLNTGLSDEIMEDGRSPRVEVLGIRADLGVVGTKIIVFDGKRGQAIYKKSEQGEVQGMVDLVLSGPKTGISAHGCFAIKIDVPGDAGGPIKWVWDCYDPEFAAEVDKPDEPVTRTICSSPGPGRNVEVTYAVMSHAAEASVQVKLRLKDDAHTFDVHGNITARIGDFKERIFLLKRTQGKCQRFSSPTSSRSLQLQLARSVVVLPSYWRLHIEVDLEIETSNKQKMKHLKTSSTFGIGNSSFSRYVVDGVQVEVNVTWYPDYLRGFHWDDDDQAVLNEMIQRQPVDISYIVGDGGEQGSFTRFIDELRCLLADHPRSKDVLVDHPQPAEVSAGRHPLLARVRSGTLKGRWLHINLQVRMPGERPESTTLLVERSNACVLGFVNQEGKPYRLGGTAQDHPLLGPTKLVPLDYSDLDVDRAHNCRSILRLNNVELGRKLNSEGLGMAVAVDAVRMLSRYGIRALVTDDEAMMALARLSVMICESARINHVYKKIADGWDEKDGARLTEQLLHYILNWDCISAALMQWKDHNYHGWVEDEVLERIGIKSPKDALDVIHLVRDPPIDERERILASIY